MASHSLTPATNMASHSLSTSIYSSPSLAPHNWILDTGATHHAAPKLGALHTAAEYSSSNQLLVGNGKGFLIKHVGSSNLNIISRSCKLTNILHVPALHKSLMYVQKFSTDNDTYFEFHPNHFVAKDRTTGDPLLSGRSNQGLYQFSNSSPQFSLKFSCRKNVHRHLALSFGSLT